MEIRWKWISIRGLIGLAAVALCCLMPALLLWFLGYVNHAEWNDQSVKTSCFIKDYELLAATCSRSCGCHSTTKTTHCNTCYYPCTDGLLVLTYDYDGVHYETSLKVVNRASEYDAREWMIENYPKASYTDCFFAPDDPKDVRVELHNVGIFLGFFIVFVILGGLVMIAWAVFETLRARSL